MEEKSDFPTVEEKLFRLKNIFTFFYGDKRKRWRRRRRFYHNWAITVPHTCLMLKKYCNRLSKNLKWPKSRLYPFRSRYLKRSVRKQARRRRRKRIEYTMKVWKPKLKNDVEEKNRIEFKIVTSLIVLLLWRVNKKRMKSSRRVA